MRWYLLLRALLLSPLDFAADARSGVEVAVAMEGALILIVASRHGASGLRSKTTFFLGAGAMLSKLNRV
jgi:hypothetical protein